MRLLVLSLLVAALSGAPASAASFGSPQTIGSGTTVATAAVAGGGGTFAFVARQQVDPACHRGLTGCAVAIFGAVRRGADAGWVTRTLASGIDYTGSDPQIAIDAHGTVTALWTAQLPQERLVAARAPAGADFGPARVVARIGFGSGARPQMVVLPSGRILVAYTDPRPTSDGPRIKVFHIDRGRPSPVRDLGVQGAYPAIAQTGDGAMLVYISGRSHCKDSTCSSGAVRATLLDASGRRSGPVATVARNGSATPNATRPQVTVSGTRAVVAWIRPRRSWSSPQWPFTREYRTRPLRARSGVRPFSIYGGLSVGAGTPSVAILPNGDLLGANVGNGYLQSSGQAGLSVAARDSAWQGPTALTEPSFGTTVPRLSRFSDGGALVIFARYDAGPEQYELTAFERSRSGVITPKAIVGAASGASDGGGVFSAVAPDGQAIVTWANLSGGIAVATSP